MAKNQYEGYQYIDLDNLYTYKNSTVLINKQNILDPKSAKNNEHLHVSKRLADCQAKIQRRVVLPRLYHPNGLAGHPYQLSQFFLG